MARIDLVTLRQRLAKQQQQPVSAEPPSWTTRPAPASAALRTTPSAAAPAGTLHATTTMRAAQPSEATNARAERVRANALRAQIDELKGEMAVASAEAEGVLAEERLRADRLSTQVEALSAEVVRAKQQVVGAEARADRAKAALAAESPRADALGDRLDGLRRPRPSRVS